MRKNILKTVFGIALLAVTVLLGLQGCEKQMLDDYSSTFENPYDFVGQYHNDGLDYVLTEIQKTFQETSTFKSAKKEELLEQVQELTRLFCKKNLLNGYDISDHIEQYNILINSGFRSASKVCEKKTLMMWRQATIRNLKKQ